MRRFFAPPENFEDQRVILKEEETRHLRDVLRLRVGDEAAVFDGTGREFNCVIETIGKKSSTLSVVAQVAPSSPESNLELTVAATVLPGDKYDLVIQKAVELGIVRLIPIVTARCEFRLSDAAKRMDRWRRIAFEASKQCGRAKLMTVSAAMKFEDLIESVDPNECLLFSERDGARFEIVQPNTRITAIFGPKGGWDDHELAAARDNKLTIITLGGRVLRAETAAIAISAILQHRFGDFN